MFSSGRLAVCPRSGPLDFSIDSVNTLSIRGFSYRHIYTLCFCPSWLHALIKTAGLSKPSPISRTCLLTNRNSVQGAVLIITGHVCYFYSCRQKPSFSLMMTVWSESLSHSRQYNGNEIKLAQNLFYCQTVYLLQLRI